MDKKKILIGIAGVAIMGIILIVLIIGYLGFFPGVSDLMGTNKPRNLGVTYSSADLASGLEKLDGVEVINEKNLCITCKYISTGSIPVESSYTSAEFTAHLNEIGSVSGPLKDAQVKFNDDGTFEASGLIDDPKFTNAFYIKGRIDDFSGKQVKVQLDESVIGNLGLGGDQAAKAEEVVNSTIQDFINKNPGMNVEDISISNGNLNYKGTMPAKIEGDPSAPVEDVFSKYGAGYID